MKTVKVWDIFVRTFHWLLVLSVITQLVTAEPAQFIHVPVGYFIVILLILRIIWGFIGSKHARFSDFIYPPRDIFAYLKGLLTKQPKNFLGHNPAGGAMVMALLLCLCLTVFAGLKTLGAEGSGPFAVNGASFIDRAYADQDKTDNNKSMRNTSADQMAEAPSENDKK